MPAPKPPARDRRPTQNAPVRPHAPRPPPRAPFAPDRRPNVPTRAMPDVRPLMPFVERHVREHLTPPRSRDLPLHRAHAETLAQLSGLFTQARPELPAGYMTQPRFRAAYLLYFLPTCAATVLHVVQSSGILPRLQPGPVRVLDLGAGPLTATLALALALPPEAQMEVTAVDASRQSMEDGAAILRALRPDAKIRLIDGNLRDGATLRKLKGPFDVILAAHVLNEWPRDTKRPAETWLSALLAEQLADPGAVVLVEPATRQASHHLIDVREHLLLESELAILAPCTGRMPCPLSATTRDWCHAEQPWQRPDLVVAMDEAIGHRRTSLKYSHLVLHTQPPPQRAGDTFRVIGGPMVANGRDGDPVLRRYVCGPDGRRVVVAPQDLAGRVWPGLPQAWRGDLLQLPGRALQLRRGRDEEPAWVPRG